tara:strand:- start:4197 stop:4544 length:348 start_codon:yes stop_codon:yes gene_type:complete
MKAKRNITTDSKSIIVKLKDQNKINDSILTYIGNLSIEDLIAIKFELSAANINHRLYGFDIWKRSDYIIKEAILKFAISATKSKKDAARFLGLTYREFGRISKKYKVEKYFSDDI